MRLRGRKTITWSLLWMTVSWCGMMTCELGTFAPHQRADLRATRQGDLLDATAHHPGRLAIAAGHGLQRLGGAAAQAVHRLHVAASNEGEQLADDGLRRRQRDVDLAALHQLGVGGAVDQRQHAPRTHALGEQAGHDVVFIVARQREEQVAFGDVLLQQQVGIGRVAMEHQHMARQLRCQVFAALGSRPR